MKMWIAIGLCVLAGVGWVLWQEHQPFGASKILWVTFENQDEGVEIAYYPGGAPLDLRTEFVPIAKALCKQNAASAVSQAFKVTGKTNADFFRVTFHYGKGETDFILFVVFAFEDGKANCNKIYQGKAPPPRSTSKGT